MATGAAPDLALPHAAEEIAALEGLDWFYLNTAGTKKKNKIQVLTAQLSILLQAQGVQCCLDQFPIAPCHISPLLFVQRGLLNHL